MSNFFENVFNVFAGAAKKTMRELGRISAQAAPYLQGIPVVGQLANLGAAAGYSLGGSYGKTSAQDLWAGFGYSAANLLQQVGPLALGAATGGIGGGGLGGGLGGLLGGGGGGGLLGGGGQGLIGAPSQMQSPGLYGSPGYSPLNLSALLQPASAGISQYVSQQIPSYLGSLFSLPPIAQATIQSQALPGYDFLLGTGPTQKTMAFQAAASPQAWQAQQTQGLLGSLQEALGSVGGLLGRLFGSYNPWVSSTSLARLLGSALPGIPLGTSWPTSSVSGPTIPTPSSSSPPSPGASPLQTGAQRRPVPFPLRR